MTQQQTKRPILDFKSKIRYLWLENSFQMELDCFKCLLVK